MSSFFHSNLHSFPTLQLQSYAVGQTASGRFKGNVARACGADSFLYLSEILAIVTVLGLVFLGIFVSLAVSVIFQRNRHLQDLASKENNYSFESFGLFWGVSTTNFVWVFIVIWFDIRQLMQVYRHLGVGMQIAWLLTIIVIALLTIDTAKSIADNSTFTVPNFYLRLATPFCSGSEPHARNWITFVAIGSDISAIQLICHHGVVAVLAVPAAPLTIVINMLLLVLAGTAVSHTLALVFTVCANWPTIRSPVWNCLRPTHWAAVRSRNVPAHDRIMLNAGILIPFFMSITLLFMLLAFSGSYVNNATEQDNFPTFFLYIFIPLLLGGRGIIDLLKWFMEWLMNDIAQLEPQVPPQEPPKQPVEELPQQQVIEELPPKQPVEELPQQQVIEELPPEQPVEELPQQQVIEELPPEQPVEELPQQQVIEELPQQQVIEELPQQQVIEELPPEQPVEELPQQQVIEELPPEQPVEELPQQQVIEELPPEQPVKELPQQQVIEELPPEQPVEELPQQQVIEELPQQQVIEELPHQQVIEGLSQEQTVKKSWHVYINPIYGMPHTEHSVPFTQRRHSLLT